MSSSVQRQTGCAHENLERTGDILLRKCNICKDGIFGVGTCFKCNGCRDYFHQICLRPQPTLQHSFYPGVNFTFSGSQGTATQRCVACYQKIQGCLYVGRNAIYIHPFCLVTLTASASNATIEDHKQRMGLHLETYVSNGGRVSTSLKLDCQMKLSDGKKCIGCKREDEVNRGFGWAYKYTYTVGGRSTTFECHVACLRAIINNNCKKQIIEKYAGDHEETEFLQRERWSQMEAFARGIAGFALPVAIAGLDLMISAFVGAPLVSLALSFLLGIGADQAEGMLRRRRG